MPIITDSGSRSWHFLGISHESGTVLGRLACNTTLLGLCHHLLHCRRGNRFRAGGVILGRPQGWQVAVRTLTSICACWPHVLSGRASLWVPRPFSPTPSLLSSVSRGPGWEEGLGVCKRAGVLDVLTTGLISSLPPTLPPSFLRGAHTSGHPVSSWPVRGSRLLWP